MHEYEFDEVLSKYVELLTLSVVVIQLSIIIDGILDIMS